MSFTFIPSGKAIKNSPIQWKFENHNTVYQSQQERFEKNVEFWRKQNGLSSTERVVTLNGEFKPLEYTEFEEIEYNCDTCKDNFNDCTCLEEYVQELNEDIKDEQPITNEPVDSPVISEPTTQPSVSQDTPDPIDTPKPKRRRKTS